MKGHSNFRPIQLENRFGIRDEAIIREAEGMFTSLAALKGMPDGDYGIEHYKAIHKHILGDMYEWAGNFRTAEISIGNNYGKSVPHSLIELELKRVLKSLQAERPQEMSQLEFADRMAMYYVKLYSVSPFPDGNARSARFMLDKFSDDSEMQIKWSEVPSEAFHAATERALNGDSGPMRQLFRVITDHKDLYDKFSINSIEQKLEKIAEQVGLRSENMPSIGLIGASQADVQKLAHYSQQVLAKDLESLGKGGATMRDWENTSIQNEMANTVGNSASNSAILSETLARIQQDGGGKPRLRGPGL